MKGAETDADIARLREDLTRVRQDVGRLWGRLLANITRRPYAADGLEAPPPEAGDMAEDLTEDMTEDMTDEMAEANTAPQDLLRKVNAAIEANPTAALLVAFGLGLVLSRASSRSRR